MKICWAAARIRRCSLVALILIAGLFLWPSQLASGQAGSGEEAASLSDVQLDELVGPIALYPDKLIAIILPASTYPLEVVQADRLLEKNKNKMADDVIKKLDFDTSILALMHYPEVLDKMNKNLDWTTKLGDAVANQQEEVMAAIQRFRANAQAAGNLVSNDQVVYETKESTIIIVSASPTVIYVPTYDPHVVVVKHDYPSTVVTFASGVAVGAWLSYGCNWHSHHIDVDLHHHSGYWGGHHNYGHIHGGVWGPSAGRRAAARTGARAGYRTGRVHGTRQGYRAGYRAGQRNNVPRTGTAGRARGTSANRATNRSANRAAGRTKSTSQARSTTRRSSGQPYGGYKSGRSARSNSSRGSRSRGRGGRRGGGGRRR